jgi:hypothetical protein
MQRAPADSNIWRANGQHTLPFGPLIQPYIKLHGSTNWQCDAGESVLIMGNAKSGAIAKFPVLKWYHEVFETCLRRGNAKLMVIGYSFQDEHINNVICAASKDYKLETFIIDPLGTAVLRDPRMRDAHTQVGRLPPDRPHRTRAPLDRVRRQRHRSREPDYPRKSNLPDIQEIAWLVRDRCLQ